MIPCVGAPKPAPEDAIRLTISVDPSTVHPGGDAEVTVGLVANKGFKLNRYPKIKVVIPEKEGLVAASETSLGNDAPPPPDMLEKNYFGTIDPLRLKLHVDKAASPGRHEIEGKLSYFYCVAASGYCAPARIPIKIPVMVR